MEKEAENFGTKVGKEIASQIKKLEKRLTSISDKYLSPIDKKAAKKEVTDVLDILNNKSKLIQDVRKMNPEDQMSYLDSLIKTDYTEEVGQQIKNAILLEVQAKERKSLQGKANQILATREPVTQKNIFQKIENIRSFEDLNDPLLQRQIAEKKLGIPLEGDQIQKLYDAGNELKKHVVNDRFDPVLEPDGNRPSKGYMEAHKTYLEVFGGINDPSLGQKLRTIQKSFMLLRMSTQTINVLGNIPQAISEGLVGRTLRAGITDLSEQELSKTLYGSKNRTKLGFSMPPIRKTSEFLNEARKDAQVYWETMYDVARNTSASESFKDFEKEIWFPSSKGGKAMVVSFRALGTVDQVFASYAKRDASYRTASALRSELMPELTGTNKLHAEDHLYKSILHPRSYDKNTSFILYETAKNRVNSSGVADNQKADLLNQYYKELKDLDVPEGKEPYIERLSKTISQYKPEFDSYISNQLEITERLEVANNYANLEADRATFQNKTMIAEIAGNVKRNLNKANILGFGLGDFLAPVLHTGSVVVSNTLEAGGVSTAFKVGGPVLKAITSSDNKTYRDVWESTVEAFTRNESSVSAMSRLPLVAVGIGLAAITPVSHYTGLFDPDKRKRGLVEEGNREYNSVLVAGKTISLELLGASQASFHGAMAVKQAGSQDVMNMIQTYFIGGASTVLDMPLFFELASFTKNAERLITQDEAEEAAEALSLQAVSMLDDGVARFIPGFISETGEILDTYERSTAETILFPNLRRSLPTPWTRFALEKKLTTFGEPITTENWLSEALFSYRVSTHRDEFMVLEYERLLSKGVNAFPTKKIENTTFDFPEEDKQELTALYGDALSKEIIPFMVTDEYRFADSDQKRGDLLLKLERDIWGDFRKDVLEARYGKSEKTEEEEEYSEEISNTIDYFRNNR